MACFIALVAIGASGGVRGSDQYWYLADLETLLQGEPHLSNTLYPRQLLRDGIERSAFYHNIIPQYGPVPVALLLGPYAAWIVMNVGMMIVAALLTWKAALEQGNRWLAAFLGAVMLLLPLSVWIGSQVLAEAALMPLFAAAMVLVQRPGRMLSWISLAVVLVLAVMSRFTSIALLLAMPVLIAVAPLARPKKVVGCLMAVTVIGGGLGLNRWLFGSGHMSDFGVALFVATRGMSVYFSSDPIGLTAHEVVDKILFSLRVFLDGSLAVKAVAIGNLVLLVLAAGGAWVVRRRGDFVVSLFILGVIIMNLATMLLYNNQVRYVVPSYPVLLVAASYPLAILLADRRRVAIVACTLVLVVLPLVDFLPALRGRDAGFKERAERAQLETISQKMRGAGDVISLGFDGQILAYGLSPRVVLFTSPDQSGSDWDRILSMPRWRWVFCPESLAPLLVKRGVELKVLHCFEFRDRSFGLYELQARTLP